MYPGASSFQRINIPEALVCSCEFQSSEEGKDGDENALVQATALLAWKDLSSHEGFLSASAAKTGAKAWELLARQWLGRY